MTAAAPLRSAGPPPERPEVAVIGGGVVGLACAAELAARGVDVCVLERDRVGHGASHGNAGWLTPSQALPLAAPGNVGRALRWMLDRESPFYVRPRADPALAAWLLRFLAASRRGPFERGARALVELCAWSTDAWERLAARAPEDFGFARAGLLAVYETAAGLDEARRGAELTARHGVPFEVWDAAAVREREPAVRGAPVGAIHYPDDAQCEPYPAVLALAAEARRAGATVVEGCEVRGALREGGRVRALDTSRGRVEPGSVVLAAGAWSGTLGRQLGVRLPMLGAKGYSLLFPLPDPAPARSIFVAERKVAVNPHRDRLRVSGTLELVGLDLSIDHRRVGAIVRGARALLDVPEPAEPPEVWRGLRPCLPDGMPAIGRARGTENLWLATGHQMTGLKTSLGTGRLLAELYRGEAPTFDPAPFRADRL